jgi:hypothetical protein
MVRIALLFAVLIAGPAARPQENALGEAAEYRILYAGKSRNVREERFLKLLKSHFARVDTIDLTQLTPLKARDYDVVIADWERRYKGGVFKNEPYGLQLDATFSKPIVMIGAVGGEIQRHTKLDWL